MWDKISQAFFSHSRDDLIDLTQNKAADIAQCLKDWRRSFECVYFKIDGQEKSLQDICHDIGINKPDDLTSEKLEQIWKEYLIDKAFPDPGHSEFQRGMMLEHFKTFMHQGGYTDMLQAAVCQSGAEKNVLVASGNVDRKLVFSVSDDQIHMEHSIKVNKLIEMRGHEAVVLDENKGDKPLMIATSKSKLSFNTEDGLPCAQVQSVTLEHNSASTRQTFDERSVKQILSDICRAIWRFFSEALSKKGQVEENTEAPQLKR